MQYKLSKLYTKLSILKIVLSAVIVLIYVHCSLYTEIYKNIINNYISMYVNVYICKCNDYLFYVINYKCVTIFKLQSLVIQTFFFSVYITFKKMILR